MVNQQAAARRNAILPDDRAILRGLDWIAQRHVRAVVALLLISLACFMPGISSIPAVDRDEARYVQATTQMLETGDYVDIRLHDDPRYLQPAGIYWAQAAFVKLFGADLPAPIWIHRLPSLIGACLIVLLTYWCGLNLGNRRVALLAGVMMASMLLLNVEARLAKTDAVLNAAILACEGVLLTLYLRSRETPADRRLALAFWVAAGVGVMVKGPVLPLVVGLTIVAACLLARDARWLSGLRALVGIPIAVAIAAPWYIAIWLASDGAFYAEAISFNVVGKITTGHQSHGFPPGFYLVAFWLSFWPVAAVTATALPAVWRERGTAAVRFLAAWIVPAWVLFEVFATKLPHYVLPLYPAIALAAAWALGAGRIDGDRAWVRILFALGAIGPAIIIAAALAGAVALGDGVSIDALALAAAAAALSVVALRLILLRSLLAGWLVLAVGVAPITYACIFGAVAPRLDSLWLSPRLAAAAADVAGCNDPAVISVGDREASLIFAVGTDIRFDDAPAAASFLAEGTCRAAIVRRDLVGPFTSALTADTVAPRAVVEVSGVNLGNMRSVVFDVYGSPGNGTAGE